MGLVTRPVICLYPLRGSFLKWKQPPRGFLESLEDKRTIFSLLSRLFLREQCHCLSESPGPTRGPSESRSLGPSPHRDTGQPRHLFASPMTQARGPTCRAAHFPRPTTARKPAPLPMGSPRKGTSKAFPTGTQGASLHLRSFSSVQAKTELKLHVGPKTSPIISR